MTISPQPDLLPTEPDAFTAAAIATLLNDGEYWQTYPYDTPWKVQHFSTHAEAFEAVRSFDDRVEKKACDDRACAAARSAAVATYQERAQWAQQHAVATSRAWRLAGSSSTEITKADAKAGFVVTIEAALLAWISGSGAAASDAVLRWSATVVLLAGVLAAIWVVLPRMPRPGTPAPRPAVSMNFGSVRHLTATDLSTKLHEVDELVAASAEAVDLAKIVHTKYVVLRWAMASGAAGLVLTVLAAAVGV
ncbi:Pycsar system effector family protein [Kribbella sp. NPDC023972]|uniref:Pycsar system effector family protein n=1 Tax=Kribbella sp. NPDC023972 TaxID=3154795 RepID=UPI0033C913F6